MSDTPQDQLPTLLELALSNLPVTHRDPWGIWCVPVDTVDGSKFEILEATREYRCRTCDQRWQFRIPE